MNNALDALSTLKSAKTTIQTIETTKESSTARQPKKEEVCIHSVQSATKRTTKRTYLIANTDGDRLIVSSFGFFLIGHDES